MLLFPTFGDPTSATAGTSPSGTGSARSARPKPWRVERLDPWRSHSLVTSDMHASLCDAASFAELALAPRAIDALVQRLVSFRSNLMASRAVSRVPWPSRSILRSVNFTRVRSNGWRRGRPDVAILKPLNASPSGTVSSLDSVLKLAAANFRARTLELRIVVSSSTSFALFTAMPTYSCHGMILGMDFSAPRLLSENCSSVSSN
mmetsp:Transcript_34214/g.71870  ORF Transcript_34214/g.71870 Transcript_34214/m.71870 type:complete len:204 (+) Transcript_34214:373-984(+)